MLKVLDIPQCSPHEAIMVSSLHLPAFTSRPAVVDLTVCASSFSPPELERSVWYRVWKNLYLHASAEGAWLYVALASEEELEVGDPLVTDVRVDEPQANLDLGQDWERRPCGIAVLRTKFSGKFDPVVSGVDVLFGTDAVDPRPQWELMRSPLQFDAPSKAPVPRLSILRGRIDSRPDVWTPRRVKNDGTFKIVQLSDMHAVTGVGVCKDAIDARGSHLPESEADPLTVEFVGKILDVEKPDLVVFTGDQLHHDVPDSQTALFKVVAPVIERSIPFVVVFGNHDSEGTHALSCSAQMEILQDLPFSYCDSGPEHIDGVGNYCLQVLAQAPSQVPVSILYFLDSHGQVSHSNSINSYEPIKQSQIDWFVSNSRAQRDSSPKHDVDDTSLLSLAFFHIPLPEFGDRHLIVCSGCRREPTEGPNINSHFYDALADEGILAVGCGHDHVNDFCAVLPQGIQQDGHQYSRTGPWLCYGGSCGFGGYGSYDGQRFHRRSRVWELDTKAGYWNTWMRVEYASNRVDELVLNRT